MEARGRFFVFECSQDCRCQDVSLQISLLRDPPSKLQPASLHGARDDVDFRHLFLRNVTPIEPHVVGDVCNLALWQQVFGTRWSMVSPDRRHR